MELIRLCKKSYIPTYKLKELLDSDNIDINYTDEDYCSALWYACYNDCDNAVRILLERGADKSIFTPDCRSETVLHWACYNNNIDMVRLLLSYGAEKTINQVSLNGQTALYLACDRMNRILVKLLLKNGAKDSVNIANCDGWTPLIIACDKDHLQIVQLLLEYGASKLINHMNENDDTALIWACENENLEIAQLLINNGANIGEAEDTSVCINNIRLYNLLLGDRNRHTNKTPLNKFFNHPLYDRNLIKVIRDILKR